MFMFVSLQFRFACVSTHQMAARQLDLERNEYKHC